MKTKNPQKYSIAAGSVVIAVYCLLIYFRVPAILTDGRFWAEEGSIYFSHAFSSGAWDSIFSIGRGVGYYSIVNSMSAFLASRLTSIENAPRITALIAFAIQILPVILILFGNIPFLDTFKSRMTAVLAVLLMQPNHEIWLATINSQFYLCLCSGLILVSGHSSASVTWFKRLILLTAGLSGVLSLFLIPIYWIAWAAEKSDRERLVQAAILTACAILEGSLILSSLAGGERNFAFHPDIILCAILGKSFILPLAGHHMTNVFNKVIYGNFSLLIPAFSSFLIICMIGYLIVRSRDKHALILFSAWLLVLLLSITGSVESSGRERLSLHILPLGAERYYYAPNLFLYFSMYILFRRHKTSNRLYAVIIIWMLGLGLYDYAVSKNKFHFFYKGPSWRLEVEKWKMNPEYRLKVWPAKWDMKL